MIIFQKNFIICETIEHLTLFRIHIKDINSISLPRNLRSCDGSQWLMVLKHEYLFNHNLANFLFNLDNDFKFEIYKLGGF